MAATPPPLPDPSDSSDSSNPTSPPPSFHWLRRLFSGHILYIASAACILIGIGQIIIPAYKELSLSRASLQGWSVLNIYELALLAATLLLVLWRRVWDDAVSLTLLVVAFIVGTSVTLDTVGPPRPLLTIGLGLLGLGLAIGKLTILARWVTTRVGVWATVGIAILLLWNFLMPGFLGFRLNKHPLDQDIQPYWIIGWCVGLIGSAAVFIGALRLPDPAPSDESQPPAPFLRTTAMGWLCAISLVAATFAHQYALNYVTLTGTPPPGDFLPALGLITLLIAELSRANAWTRKPYQLLLLHLPLAATLLAYACGGYRSHWAPSLQVINDPPVFLLEMAAALSLMAWLRRAPALHAASGAYLLTAFTLLYNDLGATQPNTAPWLWILAAFTLLALGFIASLHKSTPTPANPPN